MKKRNEHNSRVLQQIARDELRHHDELKMFTGNREEAKDFENIFLYLYFNGLGLTFGIKLMEKGGRKLGKLYRELGRYRGI